MWFVVGSQHHRSRASQPTHVLEALKKAIAPVLSVIASPGPNAGVFLGSPESPLVNVTLKNVQLGGGATHHPRYVYSLPDTYISILFTQYLDYTYIMRTMVMMVTTSPRHRLTINKLSLLGRRATPPSLRPLRSV